MAKIFTIGYGGKKPQKFIRELTSAGVEMIADVRLTPNRASMGSYVLAKSPEKGIQRLLAGAGIDYVSLAADLGNPDPKDPEMRLNRTEIAAELDERARRLRSIIADYLAGLGWTVEHL